LRLEQVDFFGDALVTDADRRGVLKVLLAAGAAELFPSIARARAIPAHVRTASLQDVEHVVILTQENRAFDHYFGAMHGVQGFADRFVIPAKNESARVDRTILVQPNEGGGEPRLIAPFRLDTQRSFAMARHDGTPHGFSDGQAAWDNGRLGAWTRAKHNHSMGYFTRADMPFQYALAEAFTLCDAYFCAMHLSTNPNRLYIWTGTHDAMGRNNGPALDNAYDSFVDPYGHGGYTWTTYPERLLQAGISFQIYQLMEDNFTDNPLVGFKTYRDARSATDGPMAELARRTITTRGLDMLRADVEAGTLPQVSWIVADAAHSEHPNPSSPHQGAEYTMQVLDALTANPEVWARTVLLINFDENDGLFDHVPPPAPPAREAKSPEHLIGGSTVALDGEYHVKSQAASDAVYLHRPYGLGPRVPMYVVSPWSRGGYVASEVFDHTSVIRFLEERFGVAEPNISPWRRAVCGDLTSCFDFRTPNNRPFVRALPATRALSDRAGALPQARPFPPEALTAPVQEEGLRRRRPTPYDLDVAVEAPGAGAPARLVLANRGEKRATVFHVYDVTDLGAEPRRFTVGAGETLPAELRDGADGWDYFIVAPGGFHRRFTARALAFSASVERGGTDVDLVISSLMTQPGRVLVEDLSYGQPSRSIELQPGQSARTRLDLAASRNWYDMRLSCGGQALRMAGYVETGAEGVSDPAAHGAAALHFESTATILDRL
jgi:phospholipase C